MPEFAGLKKEDHEKLSRAAKMYATLTGETIDVGAIPIAEPEEDAKKKAERQERALANQAELTKKLEEAKQAERKLTISQQRGDIQDENPGAGQPAMVTERAREQGVTRKGQEPPQAAPGIKK